MTRIVTYPQYGVDRPSADCDQQYHYEEVSLTVHARQLAHMAEDVLQAVSQLVRVHVAQPATG